MNTIHTLKFDPPFKDDIQTEITSDNQKTLGHTNRDYYSDNQKTLGYTNRDY